MVYGQQSLKKESLNSLNRALIWHIWRRAGPGGMWDYEAAVERCVRVRVWECVRERRERGRNEGGEYAPTHTQKHTYVVLLQERGQQQ